MMRARPLLALLLLAAAPLRGQDPDAPQPPQGRTLIQRASRPGKWLAGAASVVLIALGAREHDRAQERWDDLVALCRATNRACQTGTDGAYVDAGAERLYQESLYYERRAHRRIVAGQTTLVLAGAMFIVDLTGRKRGPRNVPFEPEQAYVAPQADGVRFGLRLTF